MTQSNPSLIPRGLYMLRKEKEDVMARLTELSGLFQGELSNRFAKARCNECVHRINLFLDDCFEQTRAKVRCQDWLNGLISDDINRIRGYGRWMLSFLIELKDQLHYFVPFNDLPSCRSLLDESVEDIAVKALDLSANGIIKASAHILSIGSEIYHLHTIDDIRRYYQDAQQQFEKDRIEGWKSSQPELLFEAKSKIELEYCTLATLKAAGKLTKDALEAGRLVIEEYQKAIEKATRS